MLAEARGARASKEASSSSKAAQQKVDDVAADLALASRRRRRCWIAIFERDGNTADWRETGRKRQLRAARARIDTV
jgi:hypothetical protein